MDILNPNSQSPFLPRLSLGDALTVRLSTPHATLETRLLPHEALALALGLIEQAALGLAPAERS
jgi:hypothetical protein